MLDQFEAVCPACSETFDLNASSVGKGFDDEEFIKVICPSCGCVRFIDFFEEERVND
jgi:hypothetical protein